MRWRALIGAVIVLFACTLLGCGGTNKTQSHPTGTVADGSTNHPASSAEVLSLAGLGTFEGSCPRGAHSWTLRFVVPKRAATDTVSYQIGPGARRTVNVDPGNAITFQLVPNAARTHEPANRFVPPVGQGRGPASATSVPTTAPLQTLIYQGTEPQTLRADVHLALAAIGGESGQCVLVGSTVHAYSYPN